MNLDNVTYDAFISYRHCELDKFVAENLHKQLEAFKVPKALLASGKTNGKTKIERVFRDRDELPLASNLADPITAALSKSDYLIVICSPRLPESKWCLKEIETFIEMHGRAHILAVLVEGEPAESFPEILRYDEKVVTDPNGRTHIEKTAVEPLAADVRGKDKKEVLKQIKSELLRLVAPILDCNYDDLKMRHKEAKQKKILRISLAISAVCLIFTAISTSMALTIHKQSETINEQYIKALETQAISYASISQNLLTEEDRLAAMTIARQALPDSLSDQTGKPYTPAAEYALSDSLGIYNNGRTNYPIKTLEQTSPIRFMLVSPEEDTITTVDANNQITIFDVDSSSILASFAVQDEYSHSISEDGIHYLGNDRIAYVADNGYFIYDIPSKEETFFESDDSYSFLKCSYDGAYIALSGYDGFQVVDPEGNQLFYQEWREHYTSDSIIAFNTEKNVVAFASQEYAATADAHAGIVYLWDLNTKKQIYETEVKITSFTQMSFLDDMLLCGGISYTSDRGGLINLKFTSYMYSFPLTKGDYNWEYIKENERLLSFTGSSEWESHTIAYAGENGITFINADDGSFLVECDVDSPIVAAAALTADGYVTVFTENGERITVSKDYASASTVMEVFDTSKGTFVDFEFCYTFNAGYRKNATAVTIYQKLTSEQAETAATTDDHILGSVYSNVQKVMLLWDMADNMYAYQVEKEDSLSLVKLENSLRTAFFTGTNDEQFCVLDWDDTLIFYDTADCEQTKSISMESVLPDYNSISWEVIDVSADGNQLAYYDSYNNTIQVYSIAEETATSLPLPEGITISAETIGMNEDFTQFAVASTSDDTLQIYDAASMSVLQQCEINASLVKNIILSKEAEALIITYLDNSATAYDTEDLSVIRTYTNFASQVAVLERIDIESEDTGESTPVYALYGSRDCYLLNHELEPVSHLYEFMGFDPDSRQFYLSSKSDMVKTPYYTYDMLIKEADRQLEGYTLSDYQKNQLGIQ